MDLQLGVGGMGDGCAWRRRSLASCNRFSRSDISSWMAVASYSAFIDAIEGVVVYVKVEVSFTRGDKARDRYPQIGASQNMVS